MSGEIKILEYIQRVGVKLKYSIQVSVLKKGRPNTLQCF